MRYRCRWATIRQATAGRLYVCYIGSWQWEYHIADMTVRCGWPVAYAVHHVAKIVETTIWRGKIVTIQGTW